MTSKFTTSTAIAITPTSDVSSSATFGLAGNLSVETSAEGDEAFFVRTFYPEFTNFSSGGSGTDDSFTFGDFPAFSDNAPGGTAEKDWNGEPLSMDALKAIMIKVEPIQAFQGTAATGTLTFAGTRPDNTNTVVIGTRTYTFKTTLAAADDVLIGANSTESRLNLLRAVSRTGTEGTHWGTGTALNTSVLIPVISGAHDPVFTAARTGAAGNLIATTETSPHLSWGATTLTGGEDVTQPAVERPLGGSVKITLGGFLLPGASSTMIYEVSTPSLLTFAVPAGWAPGASGSITVTFNSTGPAPLTDKDVNAVVTVALIGSST
jgi:hypothetical protein